MQVSCYSAGLFVRGRKYIVSHALQHGMLPTNHLRQTLFKSYRGESMSAYRYLLLLSLVVVAQAGDEWAMRWRVYSDSEAGITVRYPYDYRAPDQYKGELIRDSRGEGEIREVMVDGKMKRVMVPSNSGPRNMPDMRVISVLESDLPDEAKGKDLPAIAAILAKVNLPWKEYDYYSTSTSRPFADKKWAPKDVIALRAEGDKACGFFVKHGNRYSGVVLAGSISEPNNDDILNSFEIMQPGKSKKPSMSWREGQLRSGKVMDNKGNPVAASGKGKPAAWKEGWDVDTAHYHITSHVSPGRLVQYAQYLEILYEGFSSIYEPESMPPYKLEIHIFNTQRDFMTAAQAHGFPVGQSVGGFFVPTLMSIFVYEESSKWGGDDFSVEHVLAHECSHQFLNVACNGSRHVPTWLNEGLAVYFEAGVVNRGHFEPRMPKNRIDRLKGIYSQTKSTIIPVDQYLSHYNHISPDQYGEVYAMTNFWLFGTCRPGCKHKPKECGLAHFRDYWRRLKEKEDGTKAFEETFMEQMIKAKGSREAAIAAWQEAHFNYVNQVLK